MISGDWRWRVLIGLAVLGNLPRAIAAESPASYQTADAALKVVRIDESPDASFVSARADAAGRIFVGGREAIFVYEPDDRGGYQPRRELYRFPPHSWVFDLAIRGHDLYAATASAIYLLPNAVHWREGVVAQRLIWGQPLGHVQLGCYGLAWGPEGDLYFSSGDPLQHYGDFNRPDHWGHWTIFSQPEGTQTPHTGVGGVFRCRPDGSRLQVVARGIFRPCGLAFDRDWNLFTDDNDREAMPVQYVPARLLHVAPHADYGWPRGWLTAKSPDRADLLETLDGQLGRDAPVGLTIYDDPFLPDHYRGQLLLARWAQRLITCYRLTRRGATFQAAGQPLLLGGEQVRPVSVSVGRGGRLLATLLHMPQMEGSPTCPSELIMITRADDAPLHPFAGYDPSTASAETLWNELLSPAWSQRQVAHLELLRRGGEVASEARRRLQRWRESPSKTSPSKTSPSKTSPTSESPQREQAGSFDQLAASHLIWLAAADRAPAVLSQLTKLARHEQAHVRVQALAALTEFFPEQTPRETLELALDDASAPVRHRAVLAWFPRQDSLPAQLIDGPARDTDTYLRQSATLLLAERASLETFGELCRATDAATRLAGVLAAGFRLTLPPAAAPIDPRLPLSPYPESACVIQFADAQVDLRPLGRLGNFTIAEHWRAIEPTEEQGRLFELLVERLRDESPAVRLQAAHFLTLLNDPRNEPLVATVLRQNEEQRLAAVPVANIRSIQAVWAVGPFGDGDAGLDADHPAGQWPIDLAAEFPQGGAARSWTELKGGHFDLGAALGQQDRASYFAYCRLESAVRQRILLFLGSNDGVRVWHNGREVWRQDVVRRALAFQDAVFLPLEPGGNELLVRVHNDRGDSGLMLHFKTLGPVEPTLPERLGAASLGMRLKEATQSAANPIPAELLQTNWRRAATDGDVTQGRRLFSSDGLGCAKCHAATDHDAGGVGPSLADARRRFTTEHLVESILLPSRNVSPLFRASLITTTDGQQLTGLIVAETADKVELLLPDAVRRTLASADIESRKLLDVSPMPSGIVKTAAELRDLLAFLLREHEP